MEIKAKDIFGFFGVKKHFDRKKLVIHPINAAITGRKYRIQLSSISKKLMMLRILEVDLSQVEEDCKTVRFSI